MATESEAGGRAPSRLVRWGWPLGVFAVCALVLGLFAWDRVRRPSPQFHFIDLAWSFLHGRLDTDTPRVRQGDAKDDPWAPRGFYEAIDRQSQGGGGQPSWNDWSSFRVLELKGGDIVKGVFPWRDQKGERKNEFHTLSGELYQIDCRKDVKKGCYGASPEALKYHVSFPPAPGVLMMPLVAVWGYNVNDVLFTLFFAGLNGMLVFGLLQSLALRGHSTRTRAENLWLTAMFVFGTVSFFSSIRGEVWFTALVVGVTFNLAAIWAAIDLRRPLLAGLFVGLGMATRTPLAFSALLIGLLALFPDGRLRRDGWGRVIGRLAMFAVPVAGVLATLMVYNYARFENVFEFGHTFLQEGARPSIRDHGLLSGWFLPNNIGPALVHAPVFTFEGGPFIRISKHGLGLLWTTPALLLLFGSPKRDGIFWPLVATAFVVALPGLFYQNTGWVQFGYRFSLDWLPFLVVALAVGGRRFDWRFKALVLWGIAVNTLGAVTFDRVHSMYY